MRVIGSPLATAWCRISVFAGLFVLVLCRSSTADARSAESTEPGPVQPAPGSLSVALRAEHASGVAGNPFQNTIAGLRVDASFSSRVAVGAYLGYANLKGKSGRAHALLPYAQLEYRAPAVWGPLRAIPLRFATGYLPRNGPIMRISAGLLFSISPHMDLVTEIASPMVWVTHDRMLLSMNLALELIIR